MYSERFEALVNAVDARNDEAASTACLAVMRRAVEAFMDYKSLHDTYELQGMIGINDAEELQAQVKDARDEAVAALHVIDMVAVTYLGHGLLDASDTDDDKIIFTLVEELEKAAA